MANPAIGDDTSGTITLLNTPAPWTVPRPPPATDAPSKPPMRAWLDELGMPRRQVSRFQQMAPMRAAITTS